MKQSQRQLWKLAPHREPTTEKARFRIVEVRAIETRSPFAFHGVEGGATSGNRSVRAKMTQVDRSKANHSQPNLDSKPVYDPPPSIVYIITF